MAPPIDRRWAIIVSGILSGICGIFYPYVGAGFLFLLIGFLIVTTHYWNSVASVAIKTTGSFFG